MYFFDDCTLKTILFTQRIVINSNRISKPKRISFMLCGCFFFIYFFSDYFSDLKKILLQCAFCVC